MTVQRYLRYLFSAMGKTIKSPLVYLDIYRDELLTAIKQNFLFIAFTVPLVSVLLLQEMGFHLALVLKDKELTIAFTAVLLLREMIPVVTTLLLIGKQGSAFASHHSAWVLSDQRDAARLLQREPYERVVLPKIAAFAISLLFFALFGFFLSISCQYLFLYSGKGMSYFTAQTFRFLTLQDLSLAALKTVLFGIITPLFVFFFSERVYGGAKGLGRTTTQVLVQSTVFVILCDFLIDYLFSWF